MQKFSIILPVKNGGDYAKACVNSILNQTLNDFNLIVLDNCSTDETVSWLKGLNDSRIIIYTAAEPMSMEANWARVTTVVKNEFITIIGHDDILHPDYLETMDRLINNHPGASLYQAHFKFIDSNGNFLRHCLPMKTKQYAHEFLDDQLNHSLDSTGTGYMMRSGDYDAVGGISPLYPNLIFADYELWMKLIMKNYKATATAETFSYRLHNSTSKLTNGEAYQEAFGRYMLFLANCKTKDPAIGTVIEKFGKKMLLYYCQSLSHRLLKTESSARKTSVAAFIQQCRTYARLLIPDQPFRPMLKPGILAARLLDNPPGLMIFRLYKKIVAKK